VTLNRPDRLNALSADLLESLRRALEELGGDEGVRAVVLTGAGRGFCAGGDVGELATAGTRDERSLEVLASDTRRHLQLTELLHTMPKPTIAAVNGPCAGAGFALACAADLRYAATSAVFTTAFIKVGQPGDYGGAWTASRLLGAAKARELFLLEERIDAAQALRIGLVSEVIPDRSLLDAVHTIAHGLAAFAPIAVALLKANLNDALVLDLPRYLDAESSRFAENLRSRDAGEAARAYLEKRPPHFQGR